MPSCSGSPYSRHARCYALQDELGEELPENHNRKKRYCESEERPEKAKHTDAPMADSEPEEAYEDDEA